MQAEVDLHDRDHLYVPGRIVYMYDKPETSDEEMPLEECAVGAGAAMIDGSHKVGATIVVEPVIFSNHVFV